MGRTLIIFAFVALLLSLLGFFLTNKTEHSYNSISDQQLVKKNNSVSKSKFTVQKNNISVKRVLGSVLKKTGNLNNDREWNTVVSGDILTVDDMIQTSENSSVLLDLGQSSTIELAENASIEIRELTSAIQKLGLIRGRASVDYKKNGEKLLKIENRDKTIVATVDKGKFAIMNNGRMLAVATSTGQVDLTSAGKTVIIKEGKESHALKGSAPAKPYVIPMEVMLKIASGKCIDYPGQTVIVKGTAPIGAEVVVDNRLVDINRNGSFFIKFKLYSKDRKVMVLIKDVAGNSRKNILRCLKYTPGASIRAVNIDWGKK